MLEKTQMDDRLIAALKAEVATLRKGSGPGAGGGCGSVERPNPARCGLHLVGFEAAVATKAFTPSYKLRTAVGRP